LRGRIDRLRIKQLDQVASTDIDLNAIGSDVYAAKQRQQDRSSLVWRKGSEFFCNLTTAPDQSILFDSAGIFILDDIEDRASSASNVRSLVITRVSRLAAGIRRPFDRSLAAPVTRDVDT
jgi:hypothetical protein